MANKEFVELPSLSNVQAGNRATLNLPVGMTYHRLFFTIDGPSLSEITDLEVLINGKVVQYFADAERLDQLNQYWGRGAWDSSNGHLTLWFDRPELERYGQREMTALGTGDVQTVTVRFKIASGATVNDITAEAEKSHVPSTEDGVPDNALGTITKIKEFPKSFAVSGEVEVDSLPLGGARIGAIHLFKGDVSRVEVEADSRTIYELGKTLAEHAQAEKDRVPQSSVATTVDFMLDGDLSRAFPSEGVQSFRVRPTIGSSGNVDHVMEYLDGFGGM
jgi:hypothetical protein